MITDLIPVLIAHIKTSKKQDLNVTSSKGKEKQISPLDKESNEIVAACLYGGIWNYELFGL
jgi:hypothetical protein